MSEPKTDTVELPPGLPSPDETPDSQEIVIGHPGGTPMIGVVMKRVYRVGKSGTWEALDDDSQEVVLDTEVDYYEAEPPFCAPVAHDNDTLAFREDTDLVVQGSAYAYEPEAKSTTARLRFAGFSREITVHGDRRVERDSSGGLVFTEPEPFESIPLRYDRAYGGVDVAALLAGRPPQLDDLARARPELPVDRVSPFHYPRNPAGVGFVIRTDAYEPEDLLVPNLEYPFDPVTPERLAVGSPDNWHAAPLPAGMDWFAAGWFPRLAYLGIHDIPPGFDGKLAERERNWVAPDLLGIRPVTAAPDRPVRAEYFQAASPGMSFPVALGAVTAGIVVELINLHPERPTLLLKLPQEWPRARLELEPGKMSDLQPHLNAIVIRPDDLEVVMIWCARTERHREYTPLQYTDMKTDVAWRLRQ